MLYAKPLPGVVGPWYGLTTAISYDPDLVFVLSGNTPAFSPDEVPKSHYQSLGINPSMKSMKSFGAQGLSTSSVTPLVRETATKWFVSLQTTPTISADSQDVEELALKRLGILGGQEIALSSSQIPLMLTNNLWKRASASAESLRQTCQYPLPRDLP
mgnify:CR=1 FL=1